MADTIDVKDRIIGDHSLAWSNDNCIAIATCKNVMLYEVNPLKELRCNRMMYKIQAVPAMEALDYDAGANAFLEEYDKLRVISARDAACPDFEIYKMHLDLSMNRQYENKEVGNSGFRSVSFSPLNCTDSGGTVLAILTMGHRLILYTKVSDGTSISWCKALDLSDVLITILKNNNGYYPGITPITYKTKAQKIEEKQHAVCITCVSWCDSFIIDKGFIFLATSTKNNYLLLWKLELPIGANSKAYVVNYIKTEIQGVKYLSWSKNDSKETSHHRLAVGGIEGDIECFAVDFDGNVKKRNVLWSDKDQLSVMDIAWNAATTEEHGNGLLASKGCVLFYLRISSELKRLTHTVLKGLHVMPINSVQSLGKSLWMTTSNDGTLVKVWLKRSEGKSDQEMEPKLEHEVLARRIEPLAIFHENTHGFVFSPNKAFMATLRSKTKVSRSIQVEKYGYVDISLLQSGVEALQSINFNIDQNDCNSSKIDLLESVRLHLLHKDFFQNESDYLIFRSYVRQFLSSSEEVNSLKWFLLKMAAVLLSSDDTYEDMLFEIEKKLASRQMIKILQSWTKHKMDGDQEQPPIKSIIEWLRRNQALLNDKDQNFIKTFKFNEKLLEDEICSITGERLLISDDAKFAVTKDSSMSWCRCCLTFRALQGFKCRKCEISNSRSNVLNGNSSPMANELLRGFSIYSGLPML